MNFARRFTIGTRLGIGFTLLIGIAVALALFGRQELKVISTENARLVDDRMVKVGLLSEIKDNLNVIRAGARNIALPTDERTKDWEKRRIDEMRARNTELFKKLDFTLTADDGRDYLKAAAEAQGAYDKAMDKAIALGLAGNGKAATDALLQEVQPHQTAYFKAVDSLVDTQQRLMRKSAKETRDAASADSAVMLALAVLSGLLGTGIAFAVTRSITRPIHRAVQVANAVAAGDLTSSIDDAAQDETGQLLQALKLMNESLSQLVSQVRLSSESIATGSSQIAAGNANLSQRTEEQASSLQQTAASMGQLAGNVKGNASAAKTANEMAVTASEVASRGGVVVGQVVGTMQQIAASSNRIGDIIGVIDGIAFQTNILALNAAVEAARAGEQGRGFAVVASEVRSLARRSAEAAKEIKALIGSSVEQVKAGSELVNEAGHTMEEIVQQVKKVSDMIAEISAGTIEQTQGIAQVNAAVNQLDHVTQQNAALVEQSASASDNLKTQAIALVGAVSAFKVESATT